MATKDRVVDYSLGSWVPICLDDRLLDEGSSEGAWSFDRTEGVRIKVQPAQGELGQIDARYRGAKVEPLGIGVPFFHADADILSGTAEMTLALSRDKFRKDTKRETQDRVRRATLGAIADYVERVRCEAPQPYAVALGSLLLYTEFDEALRTRAGAEWKLVEVGGGMVADAPTITLDDLMRRRQVVLSVGRLSIDRRSQAVPLPLASLPHVGLAAANVVVRPETVEIELFSETSGRILAECLVRSDFAHRQLVRIGRHRRDGTYDPEVVLFSKDPLPDVVASDEVYREILLQVLNDYVGCRRTVPCRAQFEAIALRDDVDGWVHRIEREFTPRLLLPFVVMHDRKIRIRNLKALVSYIHKHAQTSPSHAKIVETLIRLIESVDALMKGVERWETAKGYDIAAATGELRQIGARPPT